MLIGLAVACALVETLAASSIVPPTAPPGEPGQVFVLQDYRWVPVIVRRTPTVVTCSFEVVSGNPTVRAELVSEHDFSLFAHHRAYETLTASESGRSGRFSQVVDTLGRYLVLIRNERGAIPAAVSLTVHAEVDPQETSTTVSPQRRFVVVLSSLMVLAGTVFWSGRRLLRAYRNR